MKRLLIFMALAIATITVFAQQVTDTIPIVHTTGESALDFLKTNAWNLGLIVFLLISEWLGSTGKVKEGSIYAWILNMIGKIIRSKTDVVRTKKAAFMSLDDRNRELEGKNYKPPKVSSKTPLIILLLFAFGLSASAQGPWDGFFKPMTKGTFYTKTKSLTAGEEKLWVFRPAVEGSAMKITYDKDLKQWNTASFTMIGMGVGYQHYIANGDDIYNNFGFNLLMLYTAVPTEETKSGISLAGTVSALKFLDFGVGYDFDLKAPFGLMGIKYNF
jgi:hypothetical protein